MKRLVIVASLLCGCGSGVTGDPSASAFDDTTDEDPRTQPTTPSDADESDVPDGDDTSDDPPPGPVFVPMLVAQGMLGRTIVSCDGGVTWVGNRSFADDKICWYEDDEDPRYVECDHNPGAGRGITGTGTAFITTFGWGYPGGLYRSEDGFTWTPQVEGTVYGGVNAGDGVVIAAANSPRVSTDDGVTWATTEGPYLGNVRGTGYVPYGEHGRFFTASDTAIAISSDKGESWWAPDVWPEGCGAEMQGAGGVAMVDTTIVVMGGNGIACSSTDGGETWLTHDLESTIDSRLVATPTTFYAWGNGKVFTSNDGKTWASTAVTPADVAIGPAAYDPAHHTFVAVRGGWQVWYDKQRFYRSVDGINWTVLDVQHAVRSHPMRFIAFGYAKPSAECPAP